MGIFSVGMLNMGVLTKAGTVLEEIWKCTDPSLVFQSTKLRERHIAASFF